MATETEKQAIHLHLELMHEARARTEVINHTYRNDAGFEPQFVREICYLQFRLLCETIALCCLVAHGNTSKRLRDTYEANKIVTELGKLKPAFYPEPVSIEQTGTHTHIRGRGADKEHLTKNDLIELWGKSGDVLHRAPLSKLAKPRKANPSDLSDIIKWGRKIGGLLSCYLIPLTGTRALLVEAIRHGTDKPTITIMDFSVETNKLNIEEFNGA
jgi:hypothetical protein